MKKISTTNFELLKGVFNLFNRDIVFNGHVAQLNGWTAYNNFALSTRGPFNTKYLQNPRLTHNLSGKSVIRLPSITSIRTTSSTSRISNVGTRISQDQSSYAYLRNRVFAVDRIACFSPVSDRFLFEDCIFFVSTSGTWIPYSATPNYNLGYKIESLLNILKTTLEVDGISSKKKKKPNISLRAGDRVEFIREGKLSGEKYNWASKNSISKGDKFVIAVVHNDTLVSVEGLERVPLSKFHFKKDNNE